MSEDSNELGEEGEELPPSHRLDRERGLLTKTDRELLMNQKEYDSDQGLRNARHRLREHVRNSLHDIFLVANYLKQDELEQIVQRQRTLDKEGDYYQDLLFPPLLRLGCRIAYLEAMDSTHSFEHLLTENLQSAIRGALKRQGDDSVLVDVDVDISIETVEDTEEMIDKLVSGNPRTELVVSFLAEHDPELLAERLRREDEQIDMADSRTIGADDFMIQSFIDQDTESS